MSVYFVPALIALLIKLFVLTHVIRGGKVSIVFLSLIVVFAVHNGIELFGYMYFEEGSLVNVFFRLYYVATAFACLYILLHGLSVSKLENNTLTSILIAATAVLSVLMLFSNWVIAGQYSIGYSVSAIKGPMYWLFAVYLFTVLFSTVAVILYGHHRSTAKIDSVRCLHSLMALGPVMLVFALALIFKIADIGVNATGLIPIATTLFLGIVLKTESKHKLSELRRLIPLSSERETTNNLMDLLDNYIQNSGKDNIYKELQDGIEREIIAYSLKKCDNNVSSTTKMMGLKNRSTLYSMMNRLEIEINRSRS